MNTPSNLIKSFLGESAANAINDRIIVVDEDNSVTMELIDREDNDSPHTVVAGADARNRDDLIRLAIESARVALTLAPKETLVFHVDESVDVTLFVVKDMARFNELHRLIARKSSRQNVHAALDDGDDN